uniref:Putative transcription initiation factor TFIID subunit 12-like isoform X2 n=1 Tax=Davidia involucrata TaxID=16924 RepID=A0A5B7AP05_DAVIN
MLEDVIHPPEQIPIEEISSPLSAQILEFCNPELFPETLQNSEVASSSNCCYEENSSYTTNISFAPDINKFTSPIDNNGTINTTTTAPTTTTNTTNNLSIIFDSPEEIENDISASIDFSPSSPFSVPPFLNPQQDQFDLSSLQSQVPVTDVVNGLSQYPPEAVVPIVGPTLPAVYEEEVLSSMPYMRLNPSSPSCSFLDHTIGPYLPAGNLNAALFAENSGIFNGNMLVGTELQPQELEYQGDNGGIFCPEPLPRIFNPSELQALSNESQHLVNGGGSSTPLASEISSLEDSTFKVGKLSVEQRKEKIHRYMKKRNERNFSKKIKYACRKTLADSRPRVRGRFAKNDEFGETTRTICSNHEEDTDEDVVVKEEDDISSDIFAHISGVNSFNCNYPIQSWI